MRSASLLLSLAALSACVSSGALPVQPDCTAGAVQLYSGATCVRTGPSSFVLAVRPESEPINPSPWFAFEIETREHTSATVMLDYGAFSHRYQPKQRLAGGRWQALSPDAVEIFERGGRAELYLSVPAGRTAVAAQEILTREERAEWNRSFADRARFRLSEIGRSVNGHPILAIEAGSHLYTAPLILILGGQHPPEVPGTLGLRKFLETLAQEGGPLLETHRVLIVSELNPDGVGGGFWRLNSGLVDLNRDWGPFSQPETRAVKAELDRLTQAGARPVLMLDFHATRQNTLYTPRHEASLDPPEFASLWVARIDAIYEGVLPHVSAGHNDERPTAKVWFAEQYGAPGITVEYGDETARQEIDALSVAFAQALVAVLTDRE